MFTVKINDRESIIIKIILAKKPPPSGFFNSFITQFDKIVLIEIIYENYKILQK